MPDDLRRRTLQILLNQLSSTRYPSPTILDRIEAEIEDRQTADEYVNLLLDRLEADDYPSLMLLDRVNGLIRALERSDSEAR